MNKNEYLKYGLKLPIQYSTNYERFKQLLNKEIQPQTKGLKVKNIANKVKLKEKDNLDEENKIVF